MKAKRLRRPKYTESNPKSKKRQKQKAIITKCIGKARHYLSSKFPKFLTRFVDFKTVCLISNEIVHFLTRN
jgi:hypothetical protein